MVGDQGGVLVEGGRVVQLDRGRKAPVQVGAAGFELRIVGDGADERMAELVFGSGVNTTWSMSSASTRAARSVSSTSLPTRSALNREPMAAAAFSVRLAARRGGPRGRRWLRR